MQPRFVFSLFVKTYIHCQIGDDLGQKTNSTGRLADYYAIRNEILARALLMVKATDELQMLTK